MPTVVAAPGRVNLIGDHTDYTGGLVLPMAIDRWTVVECIDSEDVIDLRSADEAEPVHLELPVSDPAAVSPRWGRYVAGVAAEMRATRGITGTVTTSIPIGSGLSSSAALEIAAAIALGFDGSPIEMALLCQRAEQRASGVPCGVMDQLCIAAAVEQHALLIDCHSLDIAPIVVPDDMAVVVRFVAPRQLDASQYADRVAQCAAAEAAIGPLRDATLDDLASLRDPVLVARARHVVTENERVRTSVTALREGNLDMFGRLMVESHRSLATDYATSTPQMDAAVEHMLARPGVHGARMTGGGFGGCIVGVVERRFAPEVAAAVGGWVMSAVGAAATR